MLSNFERDAIARASVDQSVGRLPGPRENVPIVKARPQRVRVLEAEFFFEGRVPKQGEVLTLPLDDARDLVARHLAVLV